MRAVVLDNEAVQALTNAAHPKHRTMVAHLSGIAHRRRKGAPVIAVVPTAVRVEAGWDRSTPAAAAINRFPVEDRPLERSAADVAAAITRAHDGVSVADAHVGATVLALPHTEIVVLTSDPDDMRRVSQPKPITTVRL